MCPIRFWSLPTMYRQETKNLWRSTTVGVFFDEANFGADAPNRTGDLLITNQLLYQLSYVGFRLERGARAALFIRQMAPRGKARAA